MDQVRPVGPERGQGESGRGGLQEAAAMDAHRLLGRLGPHVLSARLVHGFSLGAEEVQKPGFSGKPGFWRGNLFPVAVLLRRIRFRVGDFECLVEPQVLEHFADDGAQPAQNEISPRRPNSLVHGQEPGDEGAVH
jgi:hypothetical protein